MICSKCGAENPSYYVFCQNCFADLSKDKENNVENSSSDSVEEVEEDKIEYEDDINQEIVTDQNAENSYYEPDTITMGAESTDYSPIQTNETGSTKPMDAKAVDDLLRPKTKEKKERSKKDADQKEYSDHSTPKKSPKDSRKESKLGKLESDQGSEYYDYYDYYDESSVKEEKGRSKKTGLIILIVVLALLIAAAAFGITYALRNYGSIPAAIQAVFGGQQSVTVEETVDENNKPAHRLTIYAKAGEELLFTDPEVSQSFKLEKSEAIGYLIPDEYWVPQEPEPDQETIDVKPTVVLVTKDGTKKELEVSTYKVKVPKTELVITQPESLENLSVNAPYIDIAGVAKSGNDNPIHVMVAGFELGEDHLKEDGTFALQAALRPGNFDINVVAKAARSRSTTIVISGKEEGDGRLFSLDEGLEDPFNQETVTISGTGPATEVGEEMKVTGTAGDVTYDSQTGKFSFVARLSQLGINSFDLSVGEYNETLSLRRVPEVNEYVKSASALSFSEALASPNEAFGKVYFFDGVINEITAEDPTYAFTMNVDGDSAKVVQITYFGLATPKIGEKLRIYAAANGNAEENSVLRMNAYFMYTQEAVASVGTGNASNSDDE